MCNYHASKHSEQSRISIYGSKSCRLLLEVEIKDGLQMCQPVSECQFSTCFTLKPFSPPGQVISQISWLNLVCDIKLNRITSLFDSLARYTAGHTKATGFQFCLSQPSVGFNDLLNPHQGTKPTPCKQSEAFLTRLGLSNACDSAAAQKVPEKVPAPRVKFLQ